MRFEIESSDPNWVEDPRWAASGYTILLRAAISSNDMVPIYEHTISIQMHIENGCLLDEISLKTPVPTFSNVIHYIDYTNTQSSVVDYLQSVDGCPLE